MTTATKESMNKITDKQRKLIDAAAIKIVKKYGKTLKLLANE